MKKFYTCVLYSLLAMGVAAQKLEELGTLEGVYDDYDYGYGLISLFSIPEEFSYAGQQSLFRIIEETNEGIEFGIYNKSFDIERTIKLVAPENYRRYDIEERRAEIYNTIVRSEDCAIYPSFYSERDMGYCRFYATHYGNEKDVVYTDEYVYDWVKYAQKIYGYTSIGVTQFFIGHGWGNIMDKRELDGGSLFVIYEDSYSGAMLGFYFKNDSLLTCEYFPEKCGLIEAGIYTNDNFNDSYRDFCKMQSITYEYTTEHIVEYINYCASQGFTFTDGQMTLLPYQVDSICVMTDGETRFYPSLCQTIDGVSHPVKYFSLRDKTLTINHLEYELTYTGEWRSYTEDLSDFDLNDVLISPIHVGQTVIEDAYFCATQTLFNNDSKWEFIRPIYKERQYNSFTNDRDGDGREDYKRTEYDNSLIGYEVVSEDGSILASIEVKEGELLDNPIVIHWGDDVFLGVHVREDRHYTTIIYSIDKKTNSIKKVATSPTMHVNPAFIHRNSTVNVTLDAEIVKQGGELIITDSNGRTIARNHVEAGQTIVPVNTHRMSSGVYNITLTEKGQKVENARIVVK